MNVTFENISKVKPILWSVNILGSQETKQIYFLPQFVDTILFSSSPTFVG